MVKTSTHILDGIELLGRCANSNAQQSCYNGSKRGIHDYCVERMSGFQQGQPMVFRTSSTATHNDDSRLGRRHEGLKQEGKRQ